MKQLKVAIIHNIIAPYRIPLFEKLAAYPNVNLTVYFCSETHKIRKWDVSKNLNFKYEVLPGFLFQPRSIIFNINPVIVKKIKGEKFDVVIIGGCSDITSQLAFFTSKILQTPIILWSEGIEMSPSILGKLILPLTKYFVKRCDAIIVPGTMSRDFHFKLGAELKKIFIAPNTVDNKKIIDEIEKLRPNRSELRAKQGYSNEKIILSISQIIERKGIRYLIDAFKKINQYDTNVLLLIIGDGELKDELKNYCLRNNLSNVIFTGWVSEKEKMMYYSIANLFVLPTLSDVWGLSINEAMVCELPVITTTEAGCSQDLIVPGLNGYDIEPRDADQLFKSIKCIILENSDNKMGFESKKIIQNNFTVEKTVQGFVDAINYCLAK
jgi:glycosyltransferase involved in cell wall biosynthesis